MIMDYIFTDNDYVSLTDHWFSEIKSKFIILNPKNLPLENLSAKYQLFHIFDDPFKYLGKTIMPNMEKLIATNCFTGAEKYISRSLVIGEPTQDALLKWFNLYAKESWYTEIAKKELMSRGNGEYYRFIKERFNSAEDLITNGERFLNEFAFIWY